MDYRDSFEEMNNNDIRQKNFEDAIKQLRGWENAVFSRPQTNAFDYYNTRTIEFFTLLTAEGILHVTVQANGNIFASLSEVNLD